MIINREDLSAMRPVRYARGESDRCVRKTSQTNRGVSFRRAQFYRVV